ncbi:unnamed protein product [Bursaphelenchus okinawaensis]|uniref:EGF-like domain-containing protein n=1 Tax=Bursaphelenchus okinawaensis TaxID=465554 RepID=A0A811L3L2_9BILA|nr:unnamed protein product [Bursaphelenchus okinawaensis]CAG9116689.1 unnamed protein product [Bursaphelenchus okinawaensis]
MKLARLRGRKADKLQRLVGITVVLILRYAIPKAAAEYDEYLENAIRNDNIVPEVRVNCAQGTYNDFNNKCDCDEGWGGNRCEICTRRPCVPKARISSVVPQYGAVNETTVVHVVGVGFPRNHDKAYECIFNKTKTTGKWINSTIVECTRPAVDNDNEYSVVLLPSGLHSVISSQHNMFLDYYSNCNSDDCKGTCFKSKCICKDANTGVNCEDTKVTVKQQCGTNKTLELETEEMQELSYMITSNTTEKPFLLSSSTEELIVDELSRRIKWEKPLGHVNPYIMDIQLQRAYCSDYIKVSLMVNHSYTPQLTSVTRHKSSNMHRIAGFIKYLNTTRLQSVDLPVVIKIYEKDALIEEVKTWSTRRFFSYDVYPFTGKTTEYHITADHPNPITNSTPGLPFSHCTVDALYDNNVVAGEADFNVKYELKSQSCACGEWMAEVLWPRQLVMMKSQKISKDATNPTIELVLTADQRAKDTFEFLYVAISCDYLVTYTARHHLIRRYGNLIKISPKRLDVSLNDDQTLVEVTVETQSTPSPASLSNDLSPFFLVSSPTTRRLNNRTVQLDYVFGVRSPLKEQTLEGVLRYPDKSSPLFQIPYRISKSQDTKCRLRIKVKCMTYSENNFAEVILMSSQREILFNKFVKINSAVEFEPLDIDIYELMIRADEFLTFNQLVKVTTSNSTFTAVLTQKLSKSLTIFDEDIKFVQMDQQSTRPELMVQPSTITELDKDIWVSFIYSNGPQNSMAMITNRESNGEYYTIENLPYHMAICVGCGYKHKIKVVSTDKRLNQSDIVHLLQISYIYTVPGVMGDFQDNALVLVDLRTKRNQPPRLYPSNTNLQRYYQVSQSCHTDLASKCRQFFVRSDVCSNSWALLQTNIPSTISFMELVMFQRNCTQSGLNFEDLKQLMRCVISANSGFCEIQPYISKEHLMCTQNSLSLANTKNLYNMAAVQLNLPRFDLCNFVNGFYKHLHYLTNLLLNATNLLDEERFEKFVQTVTNQSDYQDYITLQEGLSLQESTNDLLFISKWNKIYEESQQTDHIQSRYDVDNTNPYTYLKEFVKLSRTLKELSNGISRRDPSSLLNDVISLMLRLDNTTSEVVIKAYLSVEPLYSKESGDFLVNLYLNNPTAKITLRKVRTSVKFTDFNGTLYEFPVKEQLFDGKETLDDFKVLKPGKNMTVQWNVNSRSDTKLLKTVYPTAVVNLNFEANRQFHSREIYSPMFKVDPAGSVRIIALMYPMIHGKAGVKMPFSVKLSVMNVGYLKLENVWLKNIRPQIMDEYFAGALPYTVDSMEVDGMSVTPTLDVDLSDLESGEQNNVVMNISLVKGGLGYLKNIKLSCFSHNNFVDTVNLRKFYIKHTINPTTLLIADVAEVYPLYIYHTDTAKLTSLDGLFVDQETPVASDRECLSKVLIAFRLADESKRFESPVIGTTNWPDNINKSYSLKAVFQIFPNFDVLYRTIRSDMFWVDEHSTITFLDELPFTVDSKIYYEFIFSAPDCMPRQFFSQETYRIPIPPGLHNKYSILAQIQALGEDSNSKAFTYSLKSDEENFPYVILADSGSIINMDNNIRNRSYCAVVEAKNPDGATVNSTVQLGGRRIERCDFNNTDTLQDHTLGGVHNIPFDYDRARAEFLHKSIVQVPELQVREDGINVEVDENEVVYELPEDEELEATIIPYTTVSTEEEVVLPAIPGRIYSTRRPISTTVGLSSADEQLQTRKPIVTTTKSTTISSTISVTRVSTASSTTDRAVLLGTDDTTTTSSYFTNFGATTTTSTSDTTQSVVTTTVSSTTTMFTTETYAQSTLPMKPDLSPNLIHNVTPLPTLQVLTTTTQEPVQTPHVTLDCTSLTTTAYLEPDHQVNALNATELEHVIPPLKETEAVTLKTTNQPVDATLRPSGTTIQNGRTTTSYGYNTVNQTKSTDDDVLVNLLTIPTPPTTSALPIAKGVHIDTKQTGSFSLKDQVNLGDAAAMVDMACKMKAQKPAYRVLCDLAKTVYRTQ